MVFCSPNCRLEAEFHQYECKILDYFKKEDIHVKFMLALRILTKNSFDSLLKMKKDMKILHPSKLDLKERINFNDIGFLMNLEYNKSKIDSFPLKVKILAVIGFILDALDFSGYFESDFKLSDQIFAGALILKCLRVFLTWSSTNIRDSERYMESVYPIRALFSNSCIPSTLLTETDGNVESIASIKIKKGDQVYHTWFFENHIQVNKLVRQQALIDEFGIYCRCKVRY